MRRFISHALLTAALIFSHGARAADVHPLPTIAPDAVEALTVTQLEERVGRGDARAQAELGSRYARGAGVEMDMKKAISLFEQGAKKGDATAQYFLGTAHDMGAGVEKNPAEAAHWFGQAASQNHAGGQYALSIMMTDGQGGLKADPKAAAMLTEKSAQQGYYPAAMRMAALYIQGLGVERDPNKAADWYRRVLKNWKFDVQATAHLDTLIQTKEASWQPGDPGLPPSKEPAAPMAKETFGDQSGVRPSRVYDKNAPVETKSFKAANGMTLTSRAKDGELALYATSDRPHHCEFQASFTFLNMKGERVAGTHVCFKGPRPAGKDVLLCRGDHPNFDQTRVENVEAVKCDVPPAK